MPYHRDDQLAPATGVLGTNESIQEDKKIIAALRVFNIAELMEMILLKLPPVDILRAMSTTKAMYIAATESKNVQHAIGRSPDPTANFAAIYPGISFCGLVFDTHNDMYRFAELGPTDYNYKVSRNRAEFVIIANNAPLQQPIGTQIASLSPTTVPLKQLHIYVYCKHCDDNPTFCWPVETKCTPTKNGKSITMGDLQAATIKASNEHRDKICIKPWAKPDCRVEFTGRVKLKDRDPIVKWRKDNFNAEEWRKGTRKLPESPLGMME